MILKRKKLFVENGNNNISFSFIEREDSKKRFKKLNERRKKLKRNNS